MKIFLACVLLIMPYLVKAPVFNTVPEPIYYSEECLYNMVQMMRLQAGNSVSEEDMLDKLNQPSFHLMKDKCRR